MKIYVDEQSLQDKHLDSYSIKWTHNWIDVPPNANWSIELYKNGQPCVDTVYLDLYYSSNLNTVPDGVSSHTGETSSKKKTWTSKSAYAYIASYYTDSSKQHLLAYEFLNPSYDKNNILDTIYPVNSVYITHTNKPPTFGTAWTLIKKEFKDAQGNSSSSYFTKDTTNTDTCSVYYRRTGNSLVLRLAIKTLKEITDTTAVLGTIDIEALGASSLAPTTVTMVPRGSESGVFIISCTTAGKISSIDVRPKSNSATSIGVTTLYIYENFSLRASDMIDSFCDKIYWRRTE